MSVVCLIHGTWGAKWAEPNSPFRQMLCKNRLFILPAFEWSGDISGVPSLTANGKHSDWRAGGAALSYFLKDIPYNNRNVIAHSHGGQCVAYAAAFKNTPIRRLITVSTPPREDMDTVWDAAKPNIGYHVHVASTKGDWMVRFGQMFDKHLDSWFGWDATMPSADQNVIIPGIGHSGILMEPELIPLWQRENLLEFFRASDEQLGARRVG